MKPFYFRLLFIISLTFFSGFSQDNTLLENVNGKLLRYVANRSPEKTYIHTDKDLYLNGETLWYKTYLVDGIDHSFTKNSKVVYVDLVSATDSVVVTQKLFTEGFGAAGSIVIPETIDEGDYSLRVYTKYMLNEAEPLVFSKQVTIWKDRNSMAFDDPTVKQDTEAHTAGAIDLLVDFYPEGGALVYGLENALGIKITDIQGNEVSTYGKIVDQNNTLIKDFQTHEFGLGKVSYLPEVGKTYWASVTINGQEQRFALPTPENSGYGLNVVQNKDHIVVKVSSNIQNGLQESVLVGHTRGRVFLKHDKATTKSNYLVKIPTKDLEDGVAHITLFTANGEPVCERLVFINNPENDYVLSMETTSARYGKREQVSVDLILENTQGKEPSGDFSVSVISASAREQLTESIESWLLLNSDVGGTIDNAHFFFEADTAKKRYLLDALLLTHGWRRFVWKELLEEKVSSPLLFEAEKGIMIAGKTAAFKNKYQPAAAKVRLTTIGSALFNEKQQTLVDGSFSFGPYLFNDSITVLIESEPINLSKQASENDFHIHLEDFEPTFATSTQSTSNKNRITYARPKEYIAVASQKKVVDFKNIDPKTIKLDEVTVSKKKKTLKEIIDDKANNITRYLTPDKRIFIDSIEACGALSIPDVLMQVSGVYVSGNRGNQTIIIRGGKALASPRAQNNSEGSTNIDPATSIDESGPLLIFDGMQVNLDFVNYMSVDLIEFIDVLKGPSTASFGFRGQYGVIVMYSRGTLGIKKANTDPIPNITNLTVNGFHKTREFYSPRYNIPKEEHKQQDFRTTLHWEPAITMNDYEPANIRFFTGDVSGKYLVHVEGVTADGIPVNAIQRFEVE